MAISDLTTVVAPPTDGIAPGVDWAAIEQSLGLPLPQDYNDFLHPYQPVTDNEYLDLANRREIDLDALRTIQTDFPKDVPYRLADSAELLPAALTDNGDVVYWHIHDPKDPDGWTITVNESRGPQWFRYHGGFSSFLAEGLARRVRASVFPDSFPGPAPTFARHET